MNQALYAHMNNKRKGKKKYRSYKKKKKKSILISHKMSAEKLHEISLTRSELF
jgi:hypothetical protein